MKLIYFFKRKLVEKQNKFQLFLWFLPSVFFKYKSKIVIPSHGSSNFVLVCSTTFLKVGNNSSIRFIAISEKACMKNALNFMDKYYYNKYYFKAANCDVYRTKSGCISFANKSGLIFNFISLMSAWLPELSKPSDLSKIQRSYKIYIYHPFFQDPKHNDSDYFCNGTKNLIFTWRRWAKTVQYRIVPENLLFAFRVANYS